MIKLFFISLLLLRFVCLSKAEEGERETNFLEDLLSQLNELNQADHDFESIPEPLCEYSQAGKVILNCSVTEQLTTLSGLTLSSIPTSISTYSQSLSSITINSAGLLTIAEGFGSLTLLTHLDLGDNHLTSIPSFFSSFSKLSYLNIFSNSLTTLPNELASLVSLTYLNLQNNPSLRENTVLFKEMSNLYYLDVSDTLFAGSPPENLVAFSCASSCISHEKCSKNGFCSCSIFDSDFCEMKGCSLCSDELSETCLPLGEECAPCKTFNPTNCPSRCSDRCGECSMINDSQDCVSPCSWCSSPNSCKLSTEDCPTESADSTEDDSSSLTIILICVLVPVFVLLIVIMIVVLFRTLYLRKRQKEDDESSITMTVYDTSEMDSTTFA